MVLTHKQQQFFDVLKTRYVDLPEVFMTRKEIKEVSEAMGIPFPQWVKDFNVSRGTYKFTLMNKDEIDMMKEEKVFSESTEEEFQNIMSSGLDHKFVPRKQQGYVPFGNFNDVKKILASKKFYPMYITGLSGNGKTMMVEQVCASLKREMIRANITIETDEDDLLGGFRLIDGKTVWEDGPVVTAMLRGAVLLLDEVDLGSNKLMCLQPVLEGKPIYLKKTNQLVTPAPGFNIVATANTKGQGSEDGKFIGTNVMNEAFLERFAITLEQEYPAHKTEVKILQNMFEDLKADDTQFIELLVRWADTIRAMFKQGEFSEVISTRRLVRIVEAYQIFGTRDKALTLCISRFGEDEKTILSSYYSKMDEKIQQEREAARIAEEQKNNPNSAPPAAKPAASKATPW